MLQLQNEKTSARLHQELEQRDELLQRLVDVAAACLICLSVVMRQFIIIVERLNLYIVTLYYLITLADIWKQLPFSR